MKKYLEYLTENKSLSKDKLKQMWIEDISWEPGDFEWNIKDIKYFIKQGIDVNIVSDDGDSALINFSMDGITELVELLLKQTNINVNFRSSNGLTALIVAAYNTEFDIVRMILRHPNIDVYIKDDEGKNFLDNFKQKHYQQTLVDYDLQKDIIKNNPKNIFLFKEYDLLDPDIEKEYPELFTAEKWGLLA